METPGTSSSMVGAAEAAVQRLEDAAKKLRVLCSLDYGDNDLVTTAAKDYVNALATIAHLATNTNNNINTNTATNTNNNINTTTNTNTISSSSLSHASRLNAILNTTRDIIATNSNHHHDSNEDALRDRLAAALDEADTLAINFLESFYLASASEQNAPVPPPKEPHRPHTAPSDSSHLLLQQSSHSNTSRTPSFRMPNFHSRFTTRSLSVSEQPKRIASASDAPVARTTAPVPSRPRYHSASAPRGHTPTTADSLSIDKSRRPSRSPLGHPQHPQQQQQTEQRVRSLPTSPVSSHNTQHHHHNHQQQLTDLFQPPAEVKPSPTLDHIYRLIHTMRDHLERMRTIRVSLESYQHPFLQDILYDLGTLERLYEGNMDQLRPYQDALRFVEMENQRREKHHHKIIEEAEHHRAEIEQLQSQLDAALRDKLFAEKYMATLVDENSLLKTQLMEAAKHDADNSSHVLQEAPVTGTEVQKHQQQQETPAPKVPKRRVGTSPELRDLERLREADEIQDYSDVFALQNDLEMLQVAQQNDRDAKEVEHVLWILEENEKYATKIRKESLQFSLPPDEALPPIPSSRRQSVRLEYPASHPSQVVIAQSVARRFLAARKYRRLIKRKLISRELLETEVSYVKGLLVLYKSYMIPLRYKVLAEQRILPQEKINTMFYQVREIMTCNSSLLRELGGRLHHWNKWTAIGDIFVNYATQFEMYTLFVNNYSRALGVYNEYKEQPAFREFLQKVKQEERRSLDIPDLLITPVQRIPRYVLLIKEIFKYTDSNHPDYDNLKKAIDKLQRVAEKINEKKRESERFTDVLQAEAKIINLPWKLSVPGRVLEFEGEMVEVSESGKRKPRYIFLFNDILVCTQPHKSLFASSERMTYDFRWKVRLVEAQIGSLEKLVPVEIRQEEDYAIGIVSDERHVLCTPIQADHQRILQLVHTAQKLAIVPSHQENVSKQKQGSFVLKKIEWYAGIERDLDLKEMVDVDQAVKIVRDRIKALHQRMDEESRVLTGLMRLDQVYVDRKDKTKLTTQQQETQKLLVDIKSELENQMELLSVLDVVVENGMRTGKMMAVDRRELAKVGSTLPDVPVVIRYLQQK